MQSGMRYDHFIVRIVNNFQVTALSVVGDVSRTCITIEQGTSVIHHRLQIVVTSKLFNQYIVALSSVPVYRKLVLYCAIRYFRRVYRWTIQLWYFGANKMLLTL